jgi:hypothetical protein
MTDKNTALDELSPFVNCLYVMENLRDNRGDVELTPTEQTVMREAHRIAQNHRDELYHKMTESGDNK